MDKQHSAVLQSGWELLICGAAFVVALHGGDGGLVPGWMTAAYTLCFWAQLQQDRRARGLELVQPGILATGLVLLLSAVFGYAGIREPFPLQAGLTGPVLAVLGCGLLRQLWSGHAGEQILLLGFGPLGREVVDHLDAGETLLGVLHPDRAQVPPGIPYLGDLTQLPEILRQHHPTVVVDLPDDALQGPAPVLLDFKRRGVVEAAHRVYEQRLERAYLPGIRMAGVLRAEAQRAKRRVMALQAVYSNLTGLALLLLASPVLLVLGVISRQAAGGKGSLFERVECAGFQGIPFLRRRFRTRHRETGAKTAVGAWIERWGLRDLPQIVNLNRGEMALFGPEPVRKVFSDYMDQVSPLHFYRLSVKPGILGWAEVNRKARTERQALVEEHDRMASDFYYVEHSSLVMDLEILWRHLPGSRHRNR